VVSMVALGCFY